MRAAGQSATVSATGLEILDLPGDPKLSPLLLLHEGLGSIELWRGLPNDLAELSGRRVVAYSRHGHGRSAAPEAARTPAFFHDEALRIIPALREQLQIENPVLIGHSDGGSIALIHAGRHQVSGLILLAPHVFVEGITVDAIRATREAYLAGPLRERMARYHDDVDAAFWGWCNVWLDPDFRVWNLDSDVQRVTAPTLLIQGLEDPYGTVEQIDRIEQAIPGSSRLEVSGGHSPHLEHREQILAEILRFLDEVQPQT